ncbi:MAG: C45 family autoproteolytic acyltransferase/hydrolase [Thermoanaerobaculia bacterium]
MVALRFRASIARGLAPAVLAALLGLSCAPRRPTTAPLQVAEVEPDVAPGVRRIGESWVRRIGPGTGLLLGRFAGEAYPLGQAIGRLCRADIEAQELHLERLFGAMNPSQVIRWAFRNLFSFRLRKMDRTIAPDLLTTLAGVADGYEPHTPEDSWTAYRRLLGMHAIHEVSQSFVDAPYLQSFCTGFLATGSATRNGATILARNFDFEGGSMLDRDKLVSVVAPTGQLAYLTVGFPGMVGVVSGFNSAGIGAAIQSIAGGETADVGEPMTLVLVDLLRNESTFEGAVERIRRANVFVSDMILLGDGNTGRIAVLEKTPTAFAIREMGSKGWIGISNEPQDPTVRSRGLALPMGSTSRSRESRLTSLLTSTPAGTLDVPRAVSILRDHRSAADVDLGPGNRNAINALISAHSVVFDLTNRRAWVAVAPNTLGAYVPIDLATVLSDRGGAFLVPSTPIPADPLLTSGGYDRYRAARRSLQKARALGMRPDTVEKLGALPLFERAHALSPDFVEATARLGEALARSGERERALMLLNSALAHEPAPEPLRKGVEALRDALQGNRPLPPAGILPAQLEPDELIELSDARNTPSSLLPR